MSTHEFATYVFIDGSPRGEFDMFSGGSWSVDGRLYYKPGSRFPVNFGGLAEIDDAEVSLDWSDPRAAPIYAELKNAPNTPMKITRHKRQNGVVVLEPFAIFEGPLTGCEAPEHNSQEAGDVPLKLTVSPSEEITG